MSATRRLRPPKGSNDVDAGFEEDRALRRIVRGPAVHSGGHLPAHRMVRPDSEAKGKSSRASHQRRHVGSALLRTGRTPVVDLRVEDEPSPGNSRRRVPAASCPVDRVVARHSPRDRMGHGGHSLGRGTSRLRFEFGFVDRRDNHGSRLPRRLGIPHSRGLHLIEQSLVEHAIGPGHGRCLWNARVGHPSAGGRIRDRWHTGNLLPGSNGSWSARVGAGGVSSGGFISRHLLLAKCSRLHRDAPLGHAGYGVLSSRAHLDTAALLGALRSGDVSWHCHDSVQLFHRRGACVGVRRGLLDAQASGQADAAACHQGGGGLGCPGNTVVPFVCQQPAPGIRPYAESLSRPGGRLRSNLARIPAGDDPGFVGWTGRHARRARCTRGWRAGLCDVFPPPSTVLPDPGLAPSHDGGLRSPPGFDRFAAIVSLGTSHCMHLHRCSRDRVVAAGCNDRANRRSAYGFFDRSESDRGTRCAVSPFTGFAACVLPNSQAAQPTKPRLGSCTQKT